MEIVKGEGEGRVRLKKPLWQRETASICHRVCEGVVCTCDRRSSAMSFFVVRSFQLGCSNFLAIFTVWAHLCSLALSLISWRCTNTFIFETAMPLPWASLRQCAAVMAHCSLMRKAPHW